MAKKAAKKTMSKVDNIKKAKDLIEKGKRLSDPDIVSMGLDMLDAIGELPSMVPPQEKDDYEDETKSVNQIVNKKLKQDTANSSELGKRSCKKQPVQVSGKVNLWKPPETGSDDNDRKFDQLVSAKVQRSQRREESSSVYQEKICEHCKRPFNSYAGKAFMCDTCIGGRK